MNTFRNIVTLTSIVITALVALQIGGCATQLNGTAGNRLAESLRTTQAMPTESESETSQEFVSVVEIGELRMVAQVNGEDAVLPEGWNITEQADEHLTLRYSDGSWLEIHTFDTADHAADELFAAGDTEDAQPVSRDGEDWSLEFTNSEHHVWMFNQGPQLFIVRSPLDGNNHAVTSDLASTLASIYR